MVMKETYRMTPPVFGSARFLPNDFDLHVEATGETATIPAETMVRLHPLPFLTEYSKDITWQDADVFRPERWAKGDVESVMVSDVAQHPYLNIAPFGVIHAPSGTPSIVSPASIRLTETAPPFVPSNFSGDMLY